ncbi:hypothetical protein I5U42_00540 [Stenotrophomonas maltophilia]|uniref:hypothetical protein n=1 Tax=Stenotrophomonas maltophilia TaxID=40324 RepID=UPI0015DF5FBA|nr:hypothetical protein [Stenotrophomonas maltophilia]MBA0231984.1 hypothetical protein [Stenotrophomonas maltophilia]MBH1429793.1 hypothetical protein [Stenotrophomonas maltophilia]HEL4773731.1 hypothetical protein [Stenotrophomonas maltophilia]
MSESLSVAEVVRRAAQIDAMLDAITGTAPDVVQTMGGRDALARRSEMTCLGPVPRLDAETWGRMAQEYEGLREHASVNRGDKP